MSEPLSFRDDMDESMARMMSGMHDAGYTGDADVDFLAMMIPHHAGAVDMARLVLQHGRDPATRQLAEEIIAGQTVEIDGMTRRLEQLRRGGVSAGAAAFPLLGGLRGP
ncbi:CopM family metallochaperone [Rhizobacter sp. P5_C2]